MKPLQAQVQVDATQDDDELDPVERAALHRALDESLDQEARGEVRELSAVIASLRARR